MESRVAALSSEAQLDDEGAVLLIDDDEGIREFVQSVLEDEGRRVVAAAGIDAAIEAVEAYDVWPVLLDLLLDGESGNDFLAQHAGHGLPLAPVVVLSGWDAPTEFPNGVAGHLLKPFDLDDVVRLVEEHLRRD